MVGQTMYKSGIRHVNAELTRACNLRCTYCFNDSGKKMTGELDQEQWRKIIGVSKEQGAESILFTGGEVTLRSDADRIMAYAIENGLRHYRKIK